MGVYYDNSTGEDDAQFILQGIEQCEITKDFYWSCLDDDDPKNEKNLVWISLSDPRQYLIHRDYNDFGEIITINGIQGKLTVNGCNYISCWLEDFRRHIK